MILQALNDYYQRKTNEPGSGLAEPGFEQKELPFIIEINARAITALRSQFTKYT